MISVVLALRHPPGKEIVRIRPEPPPGRRVSKVKLEGELL